MGLPIASGTCRNGGNWIRFRMSTASPATQNYNIRLQKIDNPTKVFDTIGVNQATRNVWVAQKPWIMMTSGQYQSGTIYGIIECL